MSSSSFFGIECPEFCGVGDVDHAGKYHVLMGFIAVKGGKPGSKVLCKDFALPLGKRKYLVPGELNGSGLVDAHMAGLGRKHALIAAQEGADDHRVGLGSAHQKVYICLRAGAGCPDFVSGGRAAGVGPISGHLLIIGLCQPL